MPSWAEGRHRVRGDLYVEVPSSDLSEPADTVEIGPLALRVIRKEYVPGWREWIEQKHTPPVEEE
jgi:hypothetical protein